MDYRDTLAWQKVRQATVSLQAGAWTLIVGADQTRVALIIGTAANVDVTLSTDPSAPVATGGIAVGTPVPPMFLNHMQYGAMVQCAWYGMNLTTPVSATVIELIMDNPPREPTKGE